MQKVFVGLSGGVDSAVSAALLVQQGYSVTGVFIKIWSPEFLECTWREDRLDAMRVCVALGIPFREIDLSKQYRDEVVENMLTDYQEGITPNPDVLCNEKVKFGHFAQWAFAQGADFIATGHYAQVVHKDGKAHLMRARDAAKDQSYFLYRIEQSVLARSIFAIGHMHKKDVRAHAQKLQLPIADKPDSQGLCFVGQVSLREFLGRFVTIETGVVENMKGIAIGKHDGAVFYTLGQRQGLHLDSTHNGAPQFVVAVDVARNVVRVSPDRSDASVREIHIAHMHWISENPSFPISTEMQTRYHEKSVYGEISAEGHVVFKESHLAAPGQSLVFYRDEECLGGGIICA